LKCSLIVAEIIQIMLSHVNFKVKSVRRETNIVAHTLAWTPNSWASLSKKKKVELTNKQ
jgi:hypothetical protein